MCGIVGKTERDEDFLNRTLPTIQHRGPDAKGTYIDNHVSLGMRRLSIVDLASSQPVFSENGDLVCFCNGEIYNYPELRQRLKELGHKFKFSSSDIELIPHLFQEYGKLWPLQTNGMFAAALWDKITQKLYLYRDRIGKKPLYYSIQNGVLYFASELSPLKQELSLSIDRAGLISYFFFKNASENKTAYDGIYKLDPGSFLEFDLRTKQYKIIRYWKPEFKNLDINEEDACDYFLGLLKDSVQIRTRCDVPYGVCLSGGLDSSSVAYILSKFTNKIVSFNLGYKDTKSEFLGKQTDTYFSKRVSQELGTQHHELIIDHNDFVRDFDKIFDYLCEPFSGTISEFFLSKLIQQHVKVALSGDGADELFGSYLTHRLAYYMEQYSRNQTGFSIPEHSVVVQAYTWQHIKHLKRFSFVFPKIDLLKLLSFDFHNQIKYVYNCSFGSKELDSDRINQSLEIDQNELLPNQVLYFVDRLSMANSVEIRSPYMDYRIIEFINNLPGNLKINGETKYLQKKTLERIMPKDLVYRKKEGFVQPVYLWLKHELRQWAEERLNELPKDMFNLNYIKTLSFDTDLAKIWNLICFSTWVNYAK